MYLGVAVRRRLRRHRIRATQPRQVKPAAHTLLDVAAAPRPRQAPQPPERNRHRPRIRQRQQQIRNR